MYLVIHGQTEWNRDGRTQGHGDSPLTEFGREQVARSARLLLGRVDAAKAEIVSSPLGRAMATANIVADVLGIKSAIRPDADIMELNFGDWEGKTDQEILAGWPEIMARTNEYDWLLYSPNGESHEEAIKRISKWLKGIGDHENLIVISHGIASRLLRGLFADLPHREALRLEVVRDTPFRLWGGELSKLNG